MRGRTIIGFGTLLSQLSARSTCPNLENFRKVLVPNHRRVFNKVNPNCSNFSSIYIANWSVGHSEKDHILATAFKIPEDEWDPFRSREYEYDLREVEFENLDNGVIEKGFICFEQTDCEHLEKCLKDPIRHKRFNEVRQKYRGEIWRSDILPDCEYLERCLDAASTKGQDYIDNILDHSYLADGETTIRNYLKYGGKLTEAVRRFS